METNVDDAVTQLEVTDTNCTPAYPTRIHDILYEGRVKQVKFELGEAQTLPLDIALKFLKDESFLVVDPETGKKYDPTPKQPDEVGPTAFQLGADEIVAKYDELSQEALFLRVKQMPGTESIRKNAAKDKLIAILAAGRLDEQSDNPAADDLDRLPADGSIAPMSQADLAELIPDDDETV